MTQPLDKRNLFKTAEVVTGNCFYPAGTIVTVEYDGIVEGQHYYAVSHTGKPGIIMRENNLTAFVL